MRRLIERRLRPSDKGSLRRMFDPIEYELDTSTGRVRKKTTGPIRTIDSTSGYYEFDYTSAASKYPYVSSFTILKALVNDKEISVTISKSGAILSSTYFTATREDGKVKLTVKAGYTVKVYTESLPDYLTWVPAN